MCPLSDEYHRLAALEEQTAQKREEQEQERKDLEQLRQQRQAEALAKIPEQIEELRPQLLALRGRFVSEHLTRIGIAPREQTAQLDLIPASIKKVLPNTWRSFGLVGGFGIGKSFALAALIRRKTEAGISDHLEKLLEGCQIWQIEQVVKEKHLHITPWALWINWPGNIAKARGAIFQSGSWVEEWILGIQEHPGLLILDDIGADRATQGDWTGEVLARVLDERLRQGALTVWTSNLGREELVERYGARTFSRLQALAPMIVLPAMPDLRLQRSRGAA